MFVLSPHFFLPVPQPAGIDDAHADDRDDPDAARAIIGGVSSHVKLPDEGSLIGVSIGIAIYHGEENNYSEVFKKADVALYKTKADRSAGFSICQ